MPMASSLRHAPSAGCLAPRRAAWVAGKRGGNYSRLFPDLPPLVISEAETLALGGAGGVCDGGQVAEASNTEAGWPFFGQFMAHDITGDRSPLERTDHRIIANHRAPRLNLECLYGGGPGGSPYLFDRDDPAQFLLPVGAHDVPRTSQGIAIIADPRNDSHLLMNQMHLVMLRAHNVFVDLARDRGVPEESVFDAARQALTWHYQWVVVEEFLPKLVGRDLVDAISSGQIALPLVKGLSVPYEFADAAFRYGHSQIRQSYTIRDGVLPMPIFPDMLGFRAVSPESNVDWSLFFDGPIRGGAQRSMRISERLPASLITMPFEITGAVKEPGYRSLANRDMRRGTLTDLPSGEAVARAMGLTPLAAADIGLDAKGRETPLWYYILREADTLGLGDRLGPVGGRIVAGVLLSLLDRDPASFRCLEPDWRPEIAGDGTFNVLTLLTLGATEHPYAQRPIP